MPTPAYTPTNGGAKAIADQVTANLNALTPAPNPVLSPANDAGLVAIADAVVGAFKPQAYTSNFSNTFAFPAATWTSVATWTITPSCPKTLLINGQISGYLTPTADLVNTRITVGGTVIASGIFFVTLNMHLTLPILQGVYAATSPAPIAIAFQVNPSSGNLNVNTGDIVSFSVL
jgi:hypothetical protein